MADDKRNRGDQQSGGNPDRDRQGGKTRKPGEPEPGGSGSSRPREEEEQE